MLNDTVSVAYVLATLRLSLAILRSPGMLIDAMERIVSRCAFDMLMRSVGEVRVREGRATLRGILFRLTTSCISSTALRLRLAFCVLASDSYGLRVRGARITEHRQRSGITTQTLVADER